MSVTIKGIRTPESRLNDNDMIEVGVSHQLKINGDESWVSYKVATKVRVGESADDATKRALEQVSVAMRTAVEHTVREVEEMST